MEVYLNRIDGIDDAIISMFLSKRTLTRDLELDIRNAVAKCTTFMPSDGRPIGSLPNLSEDNPDTAELTDWLVKLFRWGQKHVTMLRFIDLSFTVYGLHRAGQDDLDSHAMRMQNRIIRSSSRLADFHTGETSAYYENKIIPTDTALAILGICVPDEITYDGRTYVKGVNGYIVKGMENNRDVKRGLYMLSIPSNFIFRIDLTDFAHVFMERNKCGTANPEVKEAVESMVSQLTAATDGIVSRGVLRNIESRASTMAY